MNIKEQYIPYRQGKWRGHIHRDWAAIVSGHDPLSWMQASPHELCRERKSRLIYRMKPQGKLMYLKLMLGLNEKMMHRPSLMEKLKWRYRPSRALATSHVHQTMIAHGVRCPLPILAAREHDSRQPRDVLICEAVDLPPLGEHLASLPDDAARIHALQAVAPHVARLHRNRFLHGDLLPNNLHVSPDLTQVWFMDNDRTRRWPVPIPAIFIQRNLAQLTYRLLYFQKEPATRAFLHAYAAAAKWSSRQSESRTDRLIHHAQQRIRKENPGSRTPQPNKPSSL